MIVKRTLTTMQITQFLFGATFAATHLFVKYDIPVATAYKIVHPVSSLLAAATSTVAEVASSASSAVATPTAYGALLKRFLLRAAGEEGVAENVRDPITGHALSPAAEEAVQRYHEETRWRNEYTTVNCIDTTGQSFAIWLNLIYLAPLTALFVRFFVRAYTSRGRARGSKQSRVHKTERSAIEAAHGVDREVDEVGKAAEKGVNQITGAKPTTSGKNKDLSEEVRKDLQAMKDKHANTAKDAATEKVDEITKEAQAIKREVEDEIRGDEEGLSADERPSTSGSAAPSTPSKKNKKRKNKNKSGAADSTASLDASAGAQLSAETAKVKQGESFADAVKDETKVEGDA